LINAPDLVFTSTTSALNFPQLATLRTRAHLSVFPVALTHLSCSIEKEDNICSMLGLASHPSIPLTYLYLHWRVNDDIDNHLHLGNHTLLHLRELAVEIFAAYNGMDKILNSLTTPQLESLFLNVITWDEGGSLDWYNDVVHADLDYVYNFLNRGGGRHLTSLVMDYEGFPWTGDGFATVVYSAPFLRYLYINLPGCTYDAMFTLSHLKWLDLRVSGSDVVVEEEEEEDDDDDDEPLCVRASFTTSTKALPAILAFMDANPAVERVSIHGNFRDHHHAQLEAAGLVPTSKTYHWFKGTCSPWAWPRPRSFQ
jgi:hypothetical protein